MRTELELIEQIEKYLLNQMSGTEKKAFEEEISKDNSLREKVAAQKKIMEAVKQNALQASVKSGYRKKIFKNKLFKGGATLLLAALAVVSVIMFVGNKEPSNILYELNEKGQKTWAMADRNIKPQLFRIDNTKDTIVETEGGMVLAIQAGCFKNKQNQILKEPIDLEVKEALTPAEILTSGLSTMSGDQMLETGGMFYLSARLGSEPLQIDETKPISANVPTAEKKPGMMLFTGERRGDGTIDWVAPKELPKDLTTVDITSLNFYPPRYEDSLEGMGYDRYNKKFTDSLYYSFASLFETRSLPQPFKSTDSLKFLVDTSSLVGPQRISRINGRAVFKENCATCHSLKYKLTGPALEGVFSRVPSPQKEWLRSYIKNNNKVIASGDAYARTLVAANGGVDGMSEFEFLEDDAIDEMIKFIKLGDGYESGVEYGGITGINPAKIQSIWNEKFNNTILATKEFEERLQVIHKTYNENVLMLYVNNLSKPMWQIDSMAAEMTGGDKREKFIEFMNRREGGVKTNSGMQQKLSAYFSQQQKIYTEAAAKAYQKFLKGNADAANKFAHESEEAEMERIANEKENYEKELEKNFEEADRQLGYKRLPVAPPSGGYYSASITNLTWHNIDAYVIKATQTRTTLNYTDSVTGKKAIIKYEPLTVNISNEIEFDNTFAYLLADSLPSYMMMKNEGGVFKENLNELFTYDLVVVGLKGNDKYIFTEQSIARNTIKRVGLQKVSETEFNEAIKKLGRPSPSQKMEAEIEFRIKEKEERVRQQKVAKAEELRERIIPVIFMVGNGAENAPYAIPSK